jgi:hypothetical protein
MRMIWIVVSALMLTAAPASADPIRLRCENHSLGRPDPAVYSVLEIELEKNSLTQTNFYGGGSNKVPYKVISADAANIKAVSDHEGSREMGIDRNTGRVEVVWHTRSVTLPSGFTAPATVVNLAFECKPLKPVF